MPADDGQKVEIESPRAEIPLSRMAVGALEVRGPALVPRVDVPAPTSLIRDQRAAEDVGDLVDEVCILPDGAQTSGENISWRGPAAVN
ncbi:hypothetical protein NUW58_g69 [Xylaria curta]|uniref:Uncharacterized protein n=1 Tax=Xylaria curta TaxID=42375 RepID=A0ACC1PQK6_9PEZI|nr:hypothetical protein NUW58_g69 [Xylaria curta]